jgi:hypothetical protein
MIRMVDDDGGEHEVPERLAASVRWLVTRVAPLLAETHDPAKIVLNLGPDGAPAHMVLELHSSA